MSTTPDPTSRRTFLLALGTGAVVAAGAALTGCKSSKPKAPSDLIAVPGVDAELAEDSFTEFPLSKAPNLATTNRAVSVPVEGPVEGTVEVAVLRKADGTLMGIGNLCTHKDCPLKMRGAQGEKPVWYCTCHGSTFDLETGAVLKGPARRALDLYEVTETKDGIVRVNPKPMG